MTLPPFTLHSSLFTLHSSLFTLHSSLFTLHSSPFTLHPSLFTLHGSSRLRLNRRQERVDLPHRLIAQNAFPHRHAFFHSTVVDGLVEHGDRIVAIADLEAAQIARTLALLGVGAVTMRAKLIEQAV